MHGHLGRPDAKARFKHMFSNNRAVNVLAAARIFLFASRDVWFVVGLPVYLRDRARLELLADRRLPGDLGDRLRDRAGGGPRLRPSAQARRDAREPDGSTATWLAFVLAAFPAAIAVGLTVDLDPTAVIVIGLIAFGVVFAMNSAVHSYLILAYADNDKAAMNVGFYYMANAGGRLAGTVLSGLLYQWHGLTACLWASVSVRAGRRPAVDPPAGQDAEPDAARRRAGAGELAAQDRVVGDLLQQRLAALPAEGGAGAVRGSAGGAGAGRPGLLHPHDPFDLAELCVGIL